MNQLSPENLQTLLQYAAARLGVSADELASSVANGNYDTLTARLSDSNRRALESVLGDPQKAQAFLQHPQVQEFLKRYR